MIKILRKILRGGGKTIPPPQKISSYKKSFFTINASDFKKQVIQFCLSGHTSDFCIWGVDKNIGAPMKT